MLAIVNIAGKQYKTSKIKNSIVPRLSIDVGKKVKFDDVLYYSDEKGYHFGNPNVKGAVVTATVLAHNRERKIFVYKKKRRKGYQRKMDIVSGIQKLKLILFHYQPKKSAFKTKRKVKVKKKEK